MQSDENIVKSIIYGSPVQTSYGLFRSLCSAINHKGPHPIIQITSIKSYFTSEIIITFRNITNSSMPFDCSKHLMMSSSQTSNSLSNSDI